MAEYVVRAGDTLAEIARRNRIRHWPNLYFAPENNAFRASHLNPDRIRPGDRLVIPSAASIAPMERQPYLVHRHVPLFTQGLDTCWRATGKMVYCWRHPVRTAEADFDRLIGAEYRNSQAGLPPTRWHDFYCSHLGMRETRIRSQGELHYAVAQGGPAVVAIGDGDSAHSMVMAGYNLYRGQWVVIDPAAGESLTFADDVVTVGGGPAPAASGPAQVTAYHTGPATLANMGRWLWILDTTVAAQVFHY